MKTIINRLFNNQPSKNVCRLMIWILAVMMVSCNDNLEVSITPGGSNPVQEVVYNTAECTYYGDMIRNGATFFELDLYHSSNSNIGLLIMGFCSLSNSFANFKLDAGTYYLSENGTVRTFFPGMIEDGTFIGTCLYNFNTNKITFITSGTMTVSLSGNTYTIEGVFAGKDAVTGVAEDEMRIRFTGSVNYKDGTSPYPVKSVYTATATPRWLTNPGDRTWAGTLDPVESGNDKWYEITNWGNDNITVYCDEKGGEIVMDQYTRVASNDTYDGYFRVGYIDGAYLNLLPAGNYSVNYNPSTRILDFTGSVTEGGRQYEVLAGVAAFHKTTGNLESVFTDFYAGVTLQLTPVSTSVRSSTLQRSTSVAETLKNPHITLRQSNPATDSTPMNIVIDESDKHHIQKIPLKDLKVINGVSRQPASSLPINPKESIFTLSWD